MNNVDTAPSGTSSMTGLLEQLTERIVRSIARIFQGSDDEDTRWDMAMSILRPSEANMEAMMTDLTEEALSRGPVRENRRVG